MVQQRDPSDQLANEAKHSTMLGFWSFLSELLSMQPHGGACTHGPELVHRPESFICSFPPSNRPQRVVCQTNSVFRGWSSAQWGFLTPAGGFLKWFSAPQWRAVGERDEPEEGILFKSQLTQSIRTSLCMSAIGWHGNRVIFQQCL